MEDSSGSLSAKRESPTNAGAAPGQAGSPTIQGANAGVGLGPSQGGTGTGTGAGATPVPALPPEKETNVAFELPHAGEHYVYAVNPDTDSVAVIDANTLAIQSVEAGDQPTFLQTLAGRDAAIVLNVRSSDATLLTTSGGSTKHLNLPVQPGANAIAVAPDGKHAVVYFDPTFKGAGTNGSFQDISVLFLEPGKERAEAMTVGFQPSSVAFSADGTRGFVVTQDGISILDFGKIEKEGPAIARTIALGKDANTSLDVSVTPDGKYALARREGESQLRLANLESGDLTLLDLDAVLNDVKDVNPGLSHAETDPSASATGTDTAPIPSSTTPFTSDAGAPIEGPIDAGYDVVDAIAPLATAPSNVVTATAPTPSASAPPQPVLGSAVTDVDLAPSGEFALAVVRDRHTVIRIAIPQSFENTTPPEVIEIGDELVGSVSLAPDSKSALLYTTAVDTNKRVSILDLTTSEFRTVKLPKSVESVSIAENSKTAFVVHKKLAGDPNQAGIALEVALDRSYGYSVLDMSSGFSKLQTTPVQVGPSTLVPDASNLFVLLNSSNPVIKEVHQVNLSSFVVQHRSLGSPPTSVGAVPGSKKVFIGQEHPDGRIAFIDWETGQLESVTGFELNGRIRE
jgi:hypothetical protein